MTEIMSYGQAVLEIREEVANREHFIISGSSKDMISAISMLGERSHTVWLNADFGQIGVFKINSSEVATRNGIARLIAVVALLLSAEFGVVISVPKIEGLPEKFPRVPGKDLICVNSLLPTMAAEAMRTTWPDGTVLPPEETLRGFS